MENIFIYCLGAIFYIGGPLLLIMGIYYLYLVIRNPRISQESKDWVTADGKLTLVHQLGKKGWINNIDIRYDYIYGNQKYTGKSISHFPNTIFGKDRIEEIFEKYHLGQKVTVYTNPRRPKQAVLETELGNQTNYFLAWSVLNILIGGFLVAVMLSGFLGS